MLISNIRENGEPIGALPDGEMMFHHDMMHTEVPQEGSLLKMPSKSVSWRQHSVCQRICRLRHAARRIARTAGRPKRAFHHLQLRGSVQRAMIRARPRFRVGPPRVPHPRRHWQKRRSTLTANDRGRDRHGTGPGGRPANALFDHSETPSSSMNTNGRSATCCCGTIGARCTPAPIFQRSNAAAAAHLSSATPNRFRKHPRMPKILTGKRLPRGTRTDVFSLFARSTRTRRRRISTDIPR